MASQGFEKIGMNPMTGELIRFSRDADKYDTPDSFIKAFAGDGAYSAMMTMVKYWDITYADDSGRMMSRDECLADIEAKAEEYKADGMQMMKYCVDKLLSKSEVLNRFYK